MLDLTVMVAAFLFAYLLRFDFNPPLKEIHNALIQITYVAPIQLAALYLFGGHKHIWRYISLDDIYPFLWAAFFSSLPMLVLRLALPDSAGELRTPLSVIVMDTILAFGGILGLRLVCRAWFEMKNKLKKRAQTAVATKKPVLLIGAGRAGVALAKEILSG